jgi:hypothetical protein
MAIRKVGGEAGSPLYTACNVVATFQSSIAVGSHVSVSTSGNWCVNSAAATTDLALIGKVVDLNDASTIATVKWYGYNKVFEATYSAACAKGSYVVTDTSNKVKASGTAAGSITRTHCVALDYPSSGKVQFLAN